MHDTTTPVRISQVTPGMRLSLDSAYAINPSMANMARRHVPIACQVLAVEQQGDGGWLVEAIDHRLYRFPCDMTVDQLIPQRSDLDDLAPAAVGAGARFNGVSIE